MDWIRKTFKTAQPVIVMCHMQALPGDPSYANDRGMSWIMQKAREELHAIQEGGADAVLFSNEFSLPYLTKVDPITTVSMARIIGELQQDISIPYGVNVLWDPKASIDLAVACDAGFVREIFTGVYGSDFGLWNTNCGSVIRHRQALGGEQIRLLFNIVPESAAYLGSRNIEDVARSTVFNNRPDALCVSGLTAGSPTNLDQLARIKQVTPDTAVFANTGVNIDNVSEHLAIADGIIIASSLKRDGQFFNEIDPHRVRSFMNRVRELR